MNDLPIAGTTRLAGRPITRGETLLAAIRRRWRVAVACFVLVPLLVGVTSLLQSKEYTASSTLLFRDTNFAEQLFGTTILPTSKDPSRDAATDQNLVTLRVVADRTARVLGDGETGRSISDSVKAAPKGTSDLVVVEATDRDPRKAARIATVFTGQFVQFRREADQRVIDRAGQLVAQRLRALTGPQASSAQAQSLQRRADELEILARLQTGNAEVVQPAIVPTQASSPRIKRNIAIAMVLGLALGLGLALVADRLDQGIRTEDEVSAILPVPVLAQVPRRVGLRSPLAAGGLRPASGDLDPFRLLRSHLRFFNVDGQVKSLLVTSAEAGAGKTTISLCLGAALAQSGDRVVLVEGDLRRPALRERLGVVRPGPGLSEVLAGEAELDDAVGPVTVTFGGVSETDDIEVELSLLGSGTIPPNPTELLESHRMQEVLASLRADYDIVIVDTAPPLLVPDAVPLLRAVDGVIVVCRVGSTRRSAAQRLYQQLKDLEAPLLGTVANDIKQSRQGYGYGYGYSYRTPPPPAEEPGPVPESAA